ncbi:S-methyl-5-thioribose-1-phosphate isomerase, partial [Ascosphaera pollenicola]
MTGPRSITGTLKSIAQSAFAASSHYDRYRPSFPAKPVQALLAGLQVSGVRRARIIDLGAGTGKFTEVLARREEGFGIVAVEPHDDMRRQLEQKALRE